MITVRPAEPADAEAMSTVLIASIRDLCTADHRNDPEILAGWLRNKTPEMVLRMFDNPGALLLVAEHDGKVAAVNCRGKQLGETLEQVLAANPLAPTGSDPNSEVPPGQTPDGQPAKVGNIR